MGCNCGSRAASLFSGSWAGSQPSKPPTTIKGATTETIKTPRPSLLERLTTDGKDTSK